MTRFVIYAALIMGTIAGLEYLKYDQDNLNDARGDRAIKIALNGCATSNRIVYAEKLAEANNIIDELRFDRAQWYRAKLDNALILSFCKDVPQIKSAKLPRRHSSEVKSQR